MYLLLNVLKHFKIVYHIDECLQYNLFLIYDDIRIKTEGFQKETFFIHCALSNTSHAWMNGFTTLPQYQWSSGKTKTSNEHQMAVLSVNVEWAQFGRFIKPSPYERLAMSSL